MRKLLHAAAGVPLLALVVAVPHCVCCVVQSSCGGGTDRPRSSERVRRGAGGCVVTFTEKIWQVARPFAT